MNERNIELAEQAGFVSYELEDYTDGGYDIRYSRFANLIRADEREKVIAEFVEAGVLGYDGKVVQEIRARGNT